MPGSAQTTDYFSLFARVLPEPHILLSFDGTILAANPAFASLIGKSSDDIVFRNFQEFSTTANDELRTYLLSCTRSDQLLPLTTTFQTATGIAVCDCEAMRVAPEEGGDNEPVILLRLKPTAQYMRSMRRINERIDELSREINSRKKVEEELYKERAHLQQRIAHLEAIYHVTAALAKAETLQRIYDEALLAIGETLKTDRCSILLLDREGVMRFKAWRGLSSHYRLSVEGHSPWKADEPFPQPLVISSVQSSDIPNGLKQTVLAEGIQSMAFVPLVFHDRLIGKFMVSYNEPHEFVDEEIRLVSAIGGHVALAIERKQSEDSIKASLEEKKVLLQEIHHRVKNNMQVISSLLSLQAKRIEEPRILRMFEESRNRVQTMALIHENLYRSKDLSLIHFEDYLEELATDLFRFYAVDSKSIQLRINAKDVWVDITTAVPLGLILNELISNSLKHAFPKGNQGSIEVRMEAGEGKSKMVVSDSGIGLPETFDSSAPQTLGLRLVHILTKQLNGTLDFQSCSDGTTYTITFPR